MNSLKSIVRQILKEEIKGKVYTVVQDGSEEKSHIIETSDWYKFYVISFSGFGNFGFGVGVFADSEHVAIEEALDHMAHEQGFDGDIDRMQEEGIIANHVEETNPSEVEFVTDNGTHLIQVKYL